MVRRRWFERRGTRRSHYINPPPVPATTNKRLIRLAGDGQWEDVTWDGTDQPDSYKALYELWASEDFQERLKKYGNAGTKNASHTLGGDGYGRMAQRTAARTGEVPSAVDMYILGHRGPDPSQPDLLCTPLATDELEKYGKEMSKHYDEEYDRRNAPIDAQAVYDSGGSSSRQRRTAHDMDMERLEQEIQKRNAFLKTQEECQRQQQAHKTAGADVCDAKSLTATSTADVGNQSGHNSDFVNNLFASGGRCHSSNDPGAM
ncbi:hypothetical protein U9M48_024620 [Paspalum notatum var. saurae]|uniref:Transposase n=1 Tax=Paspalum notatum var. saurae TaxID=547442 RepID=A0AAQ3TMA3_PASNO